MKHSINIEIDELSMYDFFFSLGIPIKCGRINMWSKDDIYDAMPSFKFKFVGLDKNHIYYSQIRNCVAEFRGNKEWELITNNNSSNYILKPKDEIILNSLNNVDFYKKNIKLTIMDVPPLIKHLKARLNFK